MIPRIVQIAGGVRELKTKSDTRNELQMLSFENQTHWDAWLEKNHATYLGVWLVLARTSSEIKTLSYTQALEVALCYGWIDGQKKSRDETSWLQKFTPRGAKSIWSKVNREKAQKLIESGHMKPAGLQAVEKARQDGRWAAAYDSQRGATVPADLQAALDAHPEAKAFFATVNSRNRYAILFRVQTAKKAETRARRIQEFIRMLEKHEVLHP